MGDLSAFNFAAYCDDCAQFRIFRRIRSKCLPQLVIVSHAYIERELRKGIAALAAHIDVTVVTPNIADCLVFSALDMNESAEAIEFFSPIASIRLTGAQYLFRSLDLGFRRQRPDVICVEYNLWSVMFWQVWLARFLFAPRAKLVLSVKKNTYRKDGTFSALKTALAQATIGMPDRIIAASEMTARLYRDLFGVSSATISTFTHLGVDTDLFAPAQIKRSVNPARATLGYAGRLEPHKGVEDLIEAVKQCRISHNLDIQVRLCGGGSLLDSLRVDAGKLDWLNVEGPVPNAEIAAFLQSIDIFVLPTRILPDHQEHDAHVLLEAQACALPCIATRSGINIEMFEGGDGILVEPNEPGQLAEAIGKLIPDVQQREMLSRKVRERAVRHYDNHRLAERKANFFKEVAL